MSGAGAASGAGGEGDGPEFLDTKLQAMWDAMKSELKHVPGVMTNGQTIGAEVVAKNALPAFATHVARQKLWGKQVTVGDSLNESLCVSLIDAVEKQVGPSYQHKGLRKRLQAAETPDMKALRKLYKLLFKHVCEILLVSSDSDSD